MTCMVTIEDMQKALPNWKVRPIAGSNAVRMVDPRGAWVEFEPGESIGGDKEGCIKHLADNMRYLADRALTENERRTEVERRRKVMAEYAAKHGLTAA